ncbi:exopolysaccharide transport family protein [Tardiphaga sp. vice304]|uniref:exopolysaccharide transport family protein n=1 Tax=Tardiphaga sp. vice304 TaxID=2592817 RepID=UPI001FEE40FE|nr:exopolysaccharide transport family protein [Tardiphaga sp. vice304]
MLDSMQPNNDSQKFGDAPRSPRDADPWDVRPRAAINTSQPAMLTGMLTPSGLVAFFQRRFKRIVLLSAVLLALGIGVTMMLPVRYAATALVVIDPREQRVTTDQDVLPGIGQDAAALQSVIEIAKSDGFLRPLIEKLKIASDDEIAASETDTSRVLDNFRRRLDISRRGLTYVIAITFTSKDPQKAATYANAVAQAFVDDQAQIRSGATDDAAAWLNSRLKDLNARLRVSEEAVAAFKLEHKIVSAGRDSTTAQLRVSELSQQLAASRLRAEEAKTRYEQAQRDLKGNIEGPARPDLLSSLRAQRLQLNDQIAQKRAVFGDRHPDLMIAMSQLSEVNRQIEAERKRNIDSARSDYETLLSQQKTVEQQFRAVETAMLTDGQDAVKLQELQRDADANRNIYEQFLSRYKATSEQRQLQTSQTKVVSVANPPTRPTRPPLSIILVGLALASVLVATTITAIMDSVRTTQKDAPATAPASDPNMKPATPLLLEARPADAEAVVAGPAVTEPSEVRKLNLEEILTRQSVSPVSPVAPDRKPALSRLPVWHTIPYVAPKQGLKSVWQTPIAGSGEIDLRAACAALYEVVKSREPGRGHVVLIISEEPGVGKTAVARALGQCATERGQRSVVIGIDQPSSQRAGAPREFIDNGHHTLQADAASVLLLLTAGSIDKAASPTTDIRTEFDLIVIDTSSMSESAAIAGLAAQAEFTIIVARDNGTPTAKLGTIRSMLAAAGAGRVGLVVNSTEAPALVKVTDSHVELAS